MPYKLIGTIIVITITFCMGLEIGAIAGRAGTLIDIKGTSAYSVMLDKLRFQARGRGPKAWEAKGMLHILNEVKEEGTY
jgi:hypothetical protein